MILLNHNSQADREILSYRNVGVTSSRDVGIMSYEEKKSTFQRIPSANLFHRVLAVVVCDPLLLPRPCSRGDLQYTIYTSNKYKS